MDIATIRARQAKTIQTIRARQAKAIRAQEIAQEKRQAKHDLALPIVGAALIAFISEQPAYEGTVRWDKLQRLPKFRRLIPTRQLESLVQYLIQTGLKSHADYRNYLMGVGMGDIYWNSKSAALSPTPKPKKQFWFTKAALE